MLLRSSLALVPLLGLPLFAGDVCNPNDLQGPYGFQLSGQTTISGVSQPATGVGRVVLDGNGKISGYSSVMFAGLLLGNPVTGTYESRTDCTASWALQDDSGALQHFTGVVTPGGKKVQFRQTDPGAAQQGTLSKTLDECKVSDLRKEYEFVLSGSSVPMQTGDVAFTVDAKGLMKGDGNGAFLLSRGNSTAAATKVSVKLEAECIVNVDLTLPSEDVETSAPMTLRGILVDGGNEILAIRTDPGWMVKARFTASR